MIAQATVTETHGDDVPAELLREFRRTYADALHPKMTPSQWVQASRQRRLVWRHSRRVSLQQAAHLYGQLAAYNGFRPGMVEALEKDFSGEGITVTPGRSYSVVIYLHIPDRPALRERVEGFVRENLYPSELSWEEDETLRLWWD